MEAYLGVPCAYCLFAHRLGTGSVLGTQLGPSHAHTGPAEEATNCGSLCITKQVPRGQSQAASDVDLH